MTDMANIAIAPFWADVDTTPEINGGQNLFHRIEKGDELLALANEYVHTGFVGFRDFQATELVIITWDRVGYYNQKTDKVRTSTSEINPSRCVIIASFNHKCRVMSGFKI